MTDQPTRLNKYLAFQLGISRREADELIEEGKVTIDGSAAQLGSQVHEATVITVDGKPIENTQQHTYILLNKPIGYVCSRRKQGDNETIYTLLPPELHHLKLVGRLDKDSSGLILLTNDGDFAHQMTHPKFHKAKVYEVTLDHPLEPLHQQMISDYGVMLEDGKSQFLVEKEEESNYKITMHEGRNRQIRRTFAALGYTVKTLHRTQLGSYSLGATKSGEYRSVTSS